MASAPAAHAFDAIPVVDYTDLQKDRARFFKDLEHALCNVGFMVLTNFPGLDQDFQDKALRAAHSFFELPQDQKEVADMTLSPHFRGYYDFRVPGKVSLAAEAYQFGRDATTHEDPSTPVWHKMLRGPNIWPKDRDQLLPVKELFERYFPLARELGHLITQLLGVPPERYDRYFAETDPDFIAAMNHSLAAEEYPEADRRMMAEALAKNAPGTGAHIDGAPFVSLLIFDQPGLEVMNFDGDWVDAPQVPGSVIVNIGGTLQYLSGGRMRATLHRVNPLKCIGRRISLPYFLLPRLDEPLVKFDGKSAPHLRNRGLAFAADRMSLFPRCTQRFYPEAYEDVKARLEEEERNMRQALAKSKL